jgi:hypothetical protein
MAGRPGTTMQRPEGVVEASLCVPSGLKPTPLCAKTTNDLYVKDKLPKEDDTWWRQVRVDIRTGQQAGPGTPPQYIQEAVMLVFPDELLKTEDDRKAAQEWAEALGISLAPSGTSGTPVPGGGGGDLSAIIFAPAAGTTVSGTVQIVGRASSPNFRSYRLEYGKGTNPKDWEEIVEREVNIPNGSLGTWNVDGLEPGTYTLRLVVIDRLQGQFSATVTIKVGAPSATPTGTPPLRP